MTGIAFTFQPTPATPTTLFAAAAMMPSVMVPWPLSSIGPRFGDVALYPVTQVPDEVRVTGVDTGVQDGDDLAAGRLGQIPRLRHPDGVQVRRLVGAVELVVRYGGGVRL